MLRETNWIVDTNGISLADSAGVLDLKLNRVWKGPLDCSMNWFVYEVGSAVEGENHLRFLVVEHVKDHADFADFSFDPEV